MFCCPGLENLIGDAGQRGLSAVVRKRPNGIGFFIQARGVDFSVAQEIKIKKHVVPKLGFTLNIDTERGFRYCPYCGTELQKLVGKSPEKFDELAIKHADFLIIELL